jgi:hypothetical protein
MYIISMYVLICFFQDFFPFTAVFFPSVFWFVFCVLFCLFQTADPLPVPGQVGAFTPVGHPSPLTPE